MLFSSRVNSYSISLEYSSLLEEEKAMDFCVASGARTIKGTWLSRLLGHRPLEP